MVRGVRAKELIELNKPQQDLNGPLSQLEQQISTMPDALARAAKYVLENPERIIRLSLRELSTISGTGEATIVRLCRMLNFEGYSDFKIALASQLAVRKQFEFGSIPHDRHHLLTLADELASSILRTANAVDLNQLEEVAKRLAKAKRIDIFGAGVSGIVAELFSYRLLRAGLNAHAIRDVTLAIEVASGLGPDAAVIAISESGVTATTVEFIRTGKAIGAYALAVTSNERSPVGRQADKVLSMARMNVPAYGGAVSAVPRAILLAEAIAALIARYSDNT
ncbi:MAG: MurR/RpiR family transcriptional regulator [Hyphomicrobiales bacterium]|nr:MurR/RpiR family transcriptional regulator [Hyphomicrobiales bacterium]